MLVERHQYLKLTNMFVQSFNFIDDQYRPSVEFMLYERPYRMDLSEFCTAIGVTAEGLTSRINEQPRYLRELYACLCHDDWRESAHGKFGSIQFPAARYFGYLIARCVLARHNTSNISGPDLTIF